MPALFSHIVKVTAVITASLFLSSCSEEVITVDLNNAHPHVVIEGTIAEGAGPHTVRITKTADYYKPGANPAVSEAMVVITDNEGGSETLAETDAGLYVTSALEGIPGRTYSLTVTCEGRTYTSVSTMPPPAVIDSLAFEIEDRGEDVYIVHTFFKDTLDVEEFYRFRIYIDGVQSDDYLTYHDTLTDGNDIDYEYWLDDPVPAGTAIVVEMLSIDKPVHRFFRSLSEIVISEDGSGMIMAGTPGNPETNITGGALGYFSAYSLVSDTLIIP